MVLGRSNSAKAKVYLVTILGKPNLDVMKETLMTKLLINDEKRVYVVKVYREGGYARIYVRTEVILCAGSINSPHLLMLSGIGPIKNIWKNLKSAILSAITCKIISTHLVLQLKLLPKTKYSLRRMHFTIT